MDHDHRDAVARSSQRVGTPSTSISFSSTVWLLRLVRAAVGVSTSPHPPATPRVRTSRRRAHRARTTNPRDPEAERSGRDGVAWTVP